MPQSVYIWQRDWNRKVSEAVRQRVPAFAGAAFLAAQVEWPPAASLTPPPSPAVTRPVVDWSALKAAGKPVALAVRVHRAGPPEEVVTLLVRLFRERLAEASAAGLPVAAFQIDYDCPQKSLDRYRQWLTGIRAKLADTRIPLFLTTLPSWLGEPAFPALAGAADGYILQVHSFDLTASGKAPAICDPDSARQWVARAASLGRPFDVALPTYRCLAGYAPDGRTLGIAADAGSPSWPPGTRILEMESDPDALAALVAEWTAKRPACLRGLWWYRLPVEGEIRNWPWPTLAAVMTGRSPVSRLEARATAGNPADFTLWNTGEKDEPLPRRVSVTWAAIPTEPAAVDAAKGWSCQNSEGGLQFSTQPDAMGRRLTPGRSIPLGWLRWLETPSPPAEFRFAIMR